MIRESAGPLTVPEIFERSQQSIPGLGIATVYRTVKLLSESGQLQAVILPSGETRYESAELGHHHHFHCRVCHTVYDVAEDGDRFQPDGDEHTLDWTVVNEGIAVIDSHDDHMDLDGVAAGSTSVVFTILHGNHSDYDSPSIPITVTP